MLPDPVGSLLDGAVDGAAVRAALEPFAPELAHYAEYVVVPGETGLGFMTRGEDETFTARAGQLLDGLGFPGTAVLHHRALARWFEHKRAFFKVEWRRHGDGALTPRATCYFRRRPTVADVAERLRSMGIDEDVLRGVADVARISGKNTAHFVSAAFALDRPVEHKLYFSQYAKVGKRAEMAGHVDELLRRFEVGPGARARWARLHDRCLPEGSPTFFVSVSFGARRLEPTLKLDYPAVPPEVAAAWVDERSRAEALRVAEDACTAVGTSKLTYLGVRLRAGDDAAKVKYYIDLPRSRR